jgi:hypothetical protein
MNRMWRMLAAYAALLMGFAPGCQCEDPKPQVPSKVALEWQIAGSALPSALLSVSARSAADVFAVGADKGKGPLVVHFDGRAWQTLATGFRGDLWWVHAFPNGPVFAAGQGGMILRYDDKGFARIATPAFARQTIYGLWGLSPSDFYVVGGAAGRDGFVWHFDGERFTPVELPLGLPRTAKGELPGLFKVWGKGDDVWVVGGAGTILHRNGMEPFALLPSGTAETLFTVHGAGKRVYFVGGGAQGVLLESVDGNAPKVITPVGAPLLQGVFASATSGTWAVGERGQVYTASGNDATAATSAQGAQGAQGPLASPEPFVLSDTRLDGTFTAQSLHATTVTPEGEVWAVGGNVLSPGLDQGVIVHAGAPGNSVPTLVLEPEPDGGTGSQDAQTPAQCPAPEQSAGKGKSVARRWDEQILASIRRDLPRPPVHARNLFHLSAAMWDAWAVYDDTAKGVFVREKMLATNAESARSEAISYAALRVLEQRYRPAIGGAISLACYAALMTELGFDPSDMRDIGDDPRAIGNRIGKAIVAQTLNDGANESANYADQRPDSNPNLKLPLVIDEPGVPVGTDPNLWQPLNLAVAATQNGIVLASGVQKYIGSAAGMAKPFAMTRMGDRDLWHDPGPAPVAASDSMRAWVTEVIRRSSELGVEDEAVIDVSPGALGANTLGSNDGVGYRENPVTRASYTPVRVRRADFGRVLAEFWSDGPKSETPPGHWNVIANMVSDSESKGFERKLGGVGQPLAPLAWDVRVYLALNGAVHDAAIAAWDVKRRTVAARPLTLIRAMAQKGQSSDPAAAGYDPGGLPLAPGLIEVITKTSATKGQRHAHLAPFEGSIAIRAWLGEPGSRATQESGVGWIRAVDWLPYQRRTFVTPAFPGFISGHSSFSRAAAEVLAGITGSAWFPGGYAEVAIPAQTFLSFERGPSVAFALGWASYFDAADQAGQSRIWGGIHIAPDDFIGRKIGNVVGIEALRLAQRHFDGTAP